MTTGSRWRDGASPAILIVRLGALGDILKKVIDGVTGNSGLGDGDVVADIFRTRVLNRGKGSEVWGWGTAYGKPSQGNGVAPQPKEPTKS